MINFKISSFFTTGFILAAIAVAPALSAGPVATPAITSLSTISADRSGYVEINGTGFGTADGAIAIGGMPAPIGAWQDTRIVVWVPEAAALGGSTVR